MNWKLGLVTILSPLLFAMTAEAEIKVGDSVPDVAMRGSDGKNYKLRDFVGQKAFVIAWYPKAFTGG